MPTFTGVQVLEDVDPEVLTQIYTKGKVPVDTISNYHQKPYPNSFLVLKSNGKSAIARVSPDGQQLFVIKDSIQASGLKSRNKEQSMLLSTLLDDNVPVQIITGRAGTGKTMLALAAAMQKIEEGVYNRIILTKPMSQVGKYDLGILPGTIEEKFAPFLINYASNIEQILGGANLKKEERRKSKRTTEEPPQNGLQGVMADFFKAYNVEMVPMQLLRGASFHKAFIIADEIQVLDQKEMLTIGTRIGEGSKVVFMGDLNQRDEKIAKTATGLYKCVNDERMKQSPLVSFIDLRKVERGPVAELFSEVFEEEG